MADILGTNNPETLDGTADADNIFGLDGDDTLNGFGGNDLLDGGSGNDTMNGGIGDDIYIVDAAGDIVNENAGEGTDEIRTNRAVYSLAALANIENLTGLGTSQTLTGNALNNIITAGAGADVLDGAAGADTMIGGLGNDDYTVDDAGDMVVEAADQGTDIVRTSLAAYSIAALGNVENLTGTSNAGQSLTGNGLGNIIVGANGADMLDGGGGDDVLNGGQGADTMNGGLGDDTFSVDEAGDTVVEDVGGGNDHVLVSLATYTLAANVERMTANSAAAQTLTGNDLDNVIISNGADVLNGGGGNDNLAVGNNGTMAGGTGDDVYNVARFAVGVTIIENAGEGIDTILSSKANFSLVSLPNVENLYFVNADVGDSGNLVGNDLDNILRGSDTKSGDTLFGGLGADTMIGLDYSDRYYVDNPGDVVVEELNAPGTDTVNASIDYTLAANVENLTAFSDSGLSLTGNGLANVVTSNAGDDTLDGGLGADQLRGQGGADTFAFTAALGAGNVDTIVDFVNGDDKIGLDDDVFAGVTPANLASVFVNGTAAQDADDRIIYNSATGQLFYDADGNGAGAQVQFALLQGSVLLSSIDFVILPDPAGQNLTGTPGDDVLIGGAGDDTIDALGGNDILDGRQGVDTMNGGAGDDQFFVDSAGDVVIEAANEGYDIVYAAASYALAAGSAVEALGTTNEAAATAINLTGNELDNYVTGNAGANTLDGGGGGSDQLWGREGDDSYFADMDDIVVEYAGHGYDIVYARSSYALAAGFEIEVLGTVDNTATTALNLTGNELANYLVGNAGVNTLDGGGGADQLWGREGDDSYFVEAGDEVVEYTGHGHDIVYARTTYVLSPGMEIEVLATVNNLATTAINLTGNELGNYVTGNAGVNTIDGGGGSDLLWGREGDDSYFADSNDVVVEYAGHGYDIVYARTSFTLSVGMEIEVLGTADNLAATAIDLKGNELSNYVTGNAGANVIDGGAGSDSLHGRGGADSFAFTSALGGGNIDTIFDFGDGADRFLLDDAVFAGLGLGALGAGAFRTGSAAQDADDRIIYDQATGALYFDADGVGGVAAVQFAVLSGAPALSASDFTVI